MIPDSVFACVVQNKNVCCRLGMLWAQRVTGTGISLAIINSRGNAVSMATSQQPSISKANLLLSSTSNTLMRQNIGVLVGGKKGQHLFYSAIFLHYNMFYL